MKFTSAVVVYAATLLAITDFAFANEKKETAQAVLKEDSKYWSRFLATDYSLTPGPTPTPPPPPTPEPTPTPAPIPGTPAPSGISCDVSVSRTNDDV